MLNGSNASFNLLLMSFGLGSVLAMGSLIFLGRGTFQRAKLSMGALQWLRRGPAGIGGYCQRDQQSTDGGGIVARVCQTGA
ncbi:hypothetical protein [Pseudomonas sp. BIC9C]|uniref:hypothetical protein n=1 Tax=Pseudomonas sp. BIC9C TaxID=3078458 RepID=UPI002AD4C552|nr:hypothetical protein [Pseudomonas sp. BIC9C]